MDRNHKIGCLGCALLLALGTSLFAPETADAAPIVVPSFSFEAPDILDQTNSDATPAGWAFFDSTIVFGRVTIFDPASAIYSNTTGLAFPLPGTADGHQYVSLNNAAGQIAGNWSLTTGTLATVIDDTTYTLTVALGNSKTSNPFEFTHLDLLVNGAVVATNQVGRASIPDDTFTDFVATFTTATGDPLSGGDLAVRLRASESQFFVLGFSDYDNVRLDASAATNRAVPEPSSILLLALGGGLCWAARRRRAPRSRVNT
jgi:hypothetical protein